MTEPPRFAIRSGTPSATPAALREYAAVWGWQLRRASGPALRELLGGGKEECDRSVPVPQAWECIRVGRSCPFRRLPAAGLKRRANRRAKLVVWRAVRAEQRKAGARRDHAKSAAIGSAAQEEFYRPHRERNGSASQSSRQPHWRAPFAESPEGVGWNLRPGLAQFG